MANLREADVTMSRVLRGFLLVFPALLTLPFVGLALVVPKTDERVFSLIAAASLASMGAAMWFGLPRLLLLTRRDERVDAALLTLQGELGGATLLPTPRLPVVQPRLVTVTGGREVEIRCFPVPRSPDRWELLVMVGAPAPSRWVVVGDGFALDARARLVGLTRVDAVVPEGFAAMSDHPDRGAATLAAPGVAEAIARLAALLPMLTVERGPAGPLSLGTTWRARFEPGQDLVGAVRAALPALQELVARTDAPG